MDTGCFDVQLIVRNQGGSDTLLINDYICVHPVPEIDLGNDTVLCNDFEYSLVVPQGYYRYLWSNGSANSEITVNTTGLYWVEVESDYGCISHDSVYVGFGYAQEAKLGPDTTICQGDSLLLGPGSGYSAYYWQDGSTQNFYYATSYGLYWVNVIDSLGCQHSDTILVGIIELPDLSLGNDTTICGEFSITLEAGEGFDHYTWQDGTHAAEYIATLPGIYWVTADKAGCEKSDTVLITEECPSSIWFPNCFTPNWDGRNDRFLPVYENIIQYKIYVFNRWGQQIYESNIIDEGWDGKFKGKDCPDGVYFFLAIFTDNYHNIAKEITGSITLLR